MDRTHREREPHAQPAEERVDQTTDGQLRYPDTRKILQFEEASPANFSTTEDTHRDSGTTKNHIPPDAAVSAPPSRLPDNQSVHPRRRTTAYILCIDKNISPYYYHYYASARTDTAGHTSTLLRGDSLLFWGLG